jgi:hypothetical protein
MKERLKKAYELASRSVGTAQERQKSGYHKKVRGAILQPGDRVLVKIVAFDGKHKIADKWEEEPYRIVSQPNRDIPLYVVQRENGEGRKRTLHRNLLLPIGFLPEDENSENPNEINPAPKWQRLRKPRKKPMKPDNNEDTVELESDDESEQEYYVIYRPDEDPQNNTNSDAHHVDSDQARTINFTDDGHVEVDRGQDTSFVEDALPSEDMNDTDESTPVSDDGITVEAVGQDTEEHNSDVPDDSALTDTSLEESADVPTAPRLLPTPPRQRQRRVLPTPPRQQPDSTVARPQRNRRPPQYLSDYVTSKQATTPPEWMMKVNWLKQEAKDGKFKELEMELARTIMEIMKGTA